MNQAASPDNRLIFLGYALVGLGLVCVVVGLAWQHVVPESAFWSAEQAEAYTEANQAAHAATIVSDSEGHDHAGHSHEPMTAEERQAKIEQFDQLKQQLETARQRRQGWGRPIAILGAVLAAAGMFGLRSTAEGG